MAIRKLYAEEPNITLTPVVRVDVEGPKGLIGEMLRWMIDEDIMNRVRGGMSGGGRYVGYYTAEDAERIREWVDAWEGDDG